MEGAAPNSEGELLDLLGSKLAATLGGEVDSGSIAAHAPKIWTVGKRYIELQ